MYRRIIVIYIIRYQALNLPTVCRANIDSSLYTRRQTKYMPILEEVPQCPKDFLPEQSWEYETLNTFSVYRQQIILLSTKKESKERKIVVPTLKDSSGWSKFCLG